MAINDYIDPMDRFSQGAVIDYIGDKETAGGICRMLSLYWVIECTNGSGRSPAEALHAMKANGPIYFKQIGQSQKAYAKCSNAELKGWVGSVRECLQLASKKQRDVIVTSVDEQCSTTAADLATSISGATNHSTTLPKSCIVSISTPAGNHCIAVLVDPAGHWFIFDPNYGVLAARNPGQTLAHAVSDLWNGYRIEVSMVTPVK